MWTYKKDLEFPIKINQSNPQLAKLIVTQYGGPDGELGASLRYLSQRYSMPYAEVKGVLTDIGISVAEMLPLMGQGFVGHEVRPNCDHTSASEMLLTKCTSCVEGISVAEMLPLMGQGFVGHEVRPNCDHTSASEMLLTKCTSCVEGISVAEMLLPQNSMTDKPFSGILIHTVRSNEVLARYSKKNQFGKAAAPKKKESRHEIIIRIFV